MSPTVEGSLSVTFRIKNPSDLRLIQSILESTEAGSMLQVESSVKRPRVTGAPSQTRQETYEKIINVLKQVFPDKGFIMADAISMVAERLDRRATTTRYALTYPQEKGSVIKKGQTYVFADFIGQRIEKQLEHGQAADPVVSVPEIAAPATST